jgi:hypothetical protein
MRYKIDFILISIQNSCFMAKELFFKTEFVADLVEVL